MRERSTHPASSRPGDDDVNPGRTHPRLARWLTTERAGDDARAEEALAGLFSELPTLAPSSPLADRVMAELRPRWIDRWAAHWGVQAAAVLCLLQVALLIGVGTMTALALGGHLSLEAIVIGLTGLGVSALGFMTDAIDVLSVVVRPVEALASVLVGPQGLSIALVCFALSALALYGMIRASSTDRSWIDVAPRV